MSVSIANNNYKEADIAIIGAGIIGVCTAINLQRAGRNVTIYDPGGPAAGASSGNSGLISPDSILPISMPGIIHKVPGWLFDPSGPLAINKRYLIKAMPWLLRFLRSGTQANAKHSAQSLRILHASAMSGYKELLEPDQFHDLIRESCQLQVWDNPNQNQVAPLVQEIWAENGVKPEVLSGNAVREIEPELTTNIVGGLYFNKNGMTVNPERLVKTLFEVFQASGGKFRRERVLKIKPLGSNQIRIMTDQGEATFASVLVSAGAWSQSLLSPLGIHAPLEAERGYNVTFDDPGIQIDASVVSKAMGMALAPMGKTLRVGGTVEIAGMDAPPNEKRTRAMINNARLLFPKLQTENYSTWMGFRPSMPDSLPVIDSVKPHPGLFMAFGHGHTGMTAGPTTGQVAADLIMGRDQKIDLKPYSIDRF